MTLYVHGRPAQQLRTRRRAIGALAALVAVGLVGTCAALLAHTDRAAPEVLASGPDGAALAGPGAAMASPSPEATGLDPELQRRFDDAARAAAKAGVALTITSGWRSAAEQQDLVDEDLATYGSAAEAHRWVLPPDKSAHVQGLAIDVGPASGAAWLGEHGAQFGLCRTYANEPWHFEPVIDPGGTCPEPAPDASAGW